MRTNSIDLNGERKPAEIVSLQGYYETSSLDRTTRAYILQVMCDGLLSSGRQEVAVAIANEATLDGETVRHQGMGYTDFYLNYGGQSGYF